MIISKYEKEGNIPPDKMYRDNLDWFDLGKKCIDMIENCKYSNNSVQMPRDFKVNSCNKLENVLTQQPLQTKSTEQEYDKMNSEMNPEEVAKHIDYDLDSITSSGYESEESERNEEQSSDEHEDEIVIECENKNREVDNNLESNEIILENNKKLTEALREEMAKYKQFKTKYNAAQQELGTAEITVKEFTSI